MNTLFESGSTQFVSGSTTITLEHCTLEPSWNIPDSIKNISAVNGDVTIKDHGNYSSFVVKINLFDYNTTAEPTGAFHKFVYDILPYYQSDVYFYPLGRPIKDANGDNVLFHITQVNPYWLTTPGDFDIVEITFESKQYTSVLKTLLP